VSNIYEFFEELGKFDKVQKRVVSERFEKLNHSQKNRAEQYFSFFEHHYKSLGKSLEDIAKAWAGMVRKLIEEKYFFLKHKKYRLSRMQDAVMNVYSNENLMFDYNVWLCLSNLFNSNHICLFELYLNTISDFYGDKYLEIGPGHGLFFNEAVKAGNFNSYRGIDISKSSLQMTKNLLNYSDNLSTKVSLEEKNLFDIEETEKFDFIACGEVLEHVENPAKMLTKIYNLLSATGKCYISTAINSPAPDHIFLFKNTKQVEMLLSDCGFSILDKIEISFEQPDYTKWNDLTDVSVGYILEKNHAF